MAGGGGGVTANKCNVPFVFCKPESYSRARGSSRPCTSPGLQQEAAQGPKRRNLWLVPQPFPVCLWVSVSCPSSSPLLSGSEKMLPTPSLFLLWLAWKYEASGEGPWYFTMVFFFPAEHPTFRCRHRENYKGWRRDVLWLLIAFSPLTLTWYWLSEPFSPCPMPLRCFPGFATVAGSIVMAAEAVSEPILNYQTNEGSKCLLPKGLHASVWQEYTVCLHVCTCCTYTDKKEPFRAEVVSWVYVLNGIMLNIT